MELVQLRHFLTIAETLSFTKAAESVHISQPALSYQMKRLEEELAVKLFSRRGRSIALTAEGEIFLPMARSLLARANEAVRMVRGHSGLDTGKVTVGVIPSVANYLIPEILTSFHQVFPRVQVTLMEKAEAELQQAVFTGTADFAILGDARSVQPLEISPLGSENLMVVTSPGHRLTDQIIVNLHQLRDEEFALPASPYSRFENQIVESCRKAGFEPNVTYHVGTMETLKGLVRAGLAVSILPAISLVGIGREGMAVLRIKNGPTRGLYLVSSKDKTLSQAAQVLMAHTRSTVTRHMNYPPDTRRAPTVSPAFEKTHNQPGP